MKRRNALVLFFVLTTVLLALDRITKNVAIEQLTNNSPVAFLPSLFDFVLVYNTGGAFGLFAGGGILFVIVAVLAVAAIIIYLFKAKQLWLPVVLALALMCGGAVGNAYDRVIGGAVPDFIHTLFIEFPVFNLADIFLTVGEIMLIVLLAVYWFRPQQMGESSQNADEGQVRDEHKDSPSEQHTDSSSEQHKDSPSEQHTDSPSEQHKDSPSEQH